MLFTGEHQHTLDSKGRVILPSAYREHLAAGLCLVPSQDRCIDVFPATTFERKMEELRATLSREDPRARAYLRRVTARASRQAPDAQGRITLPPSLRDYAELDKHLMVTGSDDRVEIWDRDVYEDYMARHEAAFVDLDGPLAL